MSTGNAKWIGLKRLEVVRVVTATRCSNCNEILGFGVHDKGGVVLCDYCSELYDKLESKGKELDGVKSELCRVKLMVKRGRCSCLDLRADVLERAVRWLEEEIELLLGQWDEAKNWVNDGSFAAVGSPTNSDPDSW